MRAGVNILELNLADDYVMNSVAPFASFERLKSVVGRVRGETSAALAVKLPPKGLTFTPRAIADLMKSLRVSILVCANDLPKDLDLDIKSGIVKGAERPLSQVNAYFREAESLLDIVAVGGVNTGRDAYIAHLTGAKAVQIGSALIKEGAGALGRIDRELDALLAENGHASVAEIIGKVIIQRHERIFASAARGRAYLLEACSGDASLARLTWIPALFESPHRLARPRTPAFHVGNTGSNPVGDARLRAYPSTNFRKRDIDDAAASPASTTEK